MSDPTNVFQEQQQQATQPQEQQVTNSDVFADQLKSITNGNGEQKYKDVQTALDALKHSQDFIPQLQSDVEAYKSKVLELEAQLKASKSVEEQLESFSQANTQGTPEEATPPSNVSESDIEALLERKLAERSAQSVQSQNVQLVNDTLVEKFGDRAGEVVASKAKELGLTLEDMKSYASKNPKLILSQFEVSATASTSTPTSSVNIKTDVTPVSTLEKPDKSLLRGATQKEQAEFMRKIKEDVYARLNVTS